MILVTLDHVKTVLDRPIEIASKGDKTWRYRLLYNPTRLAFEITRRDNATANTTVIAAYGDGVVQAALDHYNSIKI